MVSMGKRGRRSVNATGTRLLPLAAALLLCACNQAPDNSRIAEVEADQVRAAADAGRIFCALAGEPNFRLDCTMDRMTSDEGATLVLGRADAGYRRFRVMTDGRGVVAADGAEPARVALIDNGMIEVAVAQDRYRIPATIRSANDQ